MRPHDARFVHAAKVALGATAIVGVLSLIHI